MSGMIQVNFSSKLNLSFNGLIKLFQKKSHLNGGSMLLAEREGCHRSSVAKAFGDGSQPGIDFVDPVMGDPASDKGATTSLLFISIPSVVCEHSLGWI
jgi:hypothetical protein